MKTIKIIDLLNMISKGEEVPRKFTYKGYLWEYDVKNKMWFYYFGESKNHRFDRLFYLNMILNDEIEIIEEPQEHKIPEKLTETTLYGVPILNKKELSNITLTNKQDIVDIKDKINKIIDYLEEIE